VTLPTTVVSNSLDSPLIWENASVERGDAVDVVARLKQESEVSLRSHGSVSMNRGGSIQELIYRPTLHV
jgi:hypothetical protein